MKVLASMLILGGMLCGCAGNEPSRENATTVVVPPNSGTTTVVVPHESGTVVLCNDGTRPPCY